MGTMHPIKWSAQGATYRLHAAVQAVKVEVGAMKIRLGDPTIEHGPFQLVGGRKKRGRG